MPSPRFWEIDFLRGAAVVLMVVFNYSFTLRFFGLVSFDNDFFWFWLPRLIGATFIFIAGASLSVSYQRNRDATKHIRRGAGIFGIGLLITAATYVSYPQYTIWFGVLHLIGMGVILSPLFARLGKLNLFPGLAFIAAGIYAGSLSSGHPWLLWLGLKPFGFETFDYFPVLPWLGVMLVGMFAGGELYRNGKRRYRIFAEPGALKPLGIVGRRSLLIYLAHQPVLVAILFAIGAASL